MQGDTAFQWCWWVRAQALNGAAQPYSELLPRVVAPGAPVARVTAAAAARTGLPTDCVVCGGTTGVGASVYLSICPPACLPACLSVCLP
jgi:sugar (pentulose or hexulose) kinase